MVECLLAELEQRKDYLEGEEVETIYFGGGTPSLLPVEYTEALIKKIRSLYPGSRAAEITLEANPDDLDQEKLHQLRAAGINRLSIGLQTFDDHLLTFLNRAHNRGQSLQSVSLAREQGFDNISLDLIYAIPGESKDRLEEDLRIITELGATHISTYCLTIEPGTAFGNWHSKGKLSPVDEDHAASDYVRIMDYLRNKGFDHYEISNFALPGYHSRHNTSYWQQKPYLGMGPGAHSYNLNSRRFNISNNAAYMKGIEGGVSYYETEELSLSDRLNEFILVSLRTRWGIDLEALRNQFGYDLIPQRNSYIRRLQDSRLITLSDNKLILTDKGKLLADQIAEDLFEVSREEK